ncbi:MAG: hypothetical protein KKD46_04200 [Euryarchaeota archaeon]|nr:hypothetical protein [Euryarchaeota archaeon]MBU4222498.1 hypothetical protein [Euryarchaeota archaeon]MBU4340104.1 hypothetical protein [Euryarchaeota archaeon]MBU4454111.1 hypothetical protein [Euryarchaeota archaeon]
MFNLAAVHDVNTGIILTTLTIAFLKNREISILVLTALLLIMANIVLGMKLRGIF